MHHQESSAIPAGTDGPGPTATGPSPATTAPPPGLIRRLVVRGTIIFTVAHLLGVLSSINALLTTRTPQGAVAWIVALNSMPIVSVPAYWIFGRTKFHGYVTARRQRDSVAAGNTRGILGRLAPFRPAPEAHPDLAAFERLARLPLLTGNALELLIDGEATFDSILRGIDEAREYVLVQFYIVHDDGLGRALKDRLIDRARHGVKVWFLYDEIGSHGLPSTYLDDLRGAGVRITPFNTTRGPSNRFQLNFRNHRKIVVVDGRTGWVGGHNVGDEYLGRNPKFGPWRDTHLKVTGPAVLGLQVSFVEDWHWAADDPLNLNWDPRGAADGNAAVVMIPSGPADELETASLMFTHAILSAKRRVWIASPYFVPDQAVLSALHLALLRGVEVRLLVPERPDNVLVHYSKYALVGSLIRAGARIHCHQPGFLHEKVFLVDDHIAGVGTANFDNRSFRLNFEITALVSDPAFAASVQHMFERDFEHSRLMTREEVDGKSAWFTVLARAAYLTAPIQ